MISNTKNNNASTLALSIVKVTDYCTSIIDDVLAVEEPLEIKLAFLLEGKKNVKNISVTMRTPGNDEELALGFLFTEGIIKKIEDVKQIKKIGIDGNSVLVELIDSVQPQLNKLERNFYTTSSCGVCGKASIDAIRIVSDTILKDSFWKVKASTIYNLPDKLNSQQTLFKQTGGIHASALFTLDGELNLLNEDVGRHNALDKLIGSAIKNNLLPLANHILLLSGRASFELIQKAAMANIKLIVAVGAPSSLAVQLAQEFNMTLVGFLRGNKFNIYCGNERVVLN